jgi:dihydrofolate reductase
MRRVLYGAACSLDGYIAGPADELDWLHWSDDVAAITAAVWADIDTVVMGRRTYEVARRNGTEAYPGVENYVFSRSHDETESAVRWVRSDAVAFLRELIGKPGKGICVLGGGVLARDLLAAGLISEVGLNIHPILLGEGIPMFLPLAASSSLELLDARLLDGGCYYLLYSVLNKTARE